LAFETPVLLPVLWVSLEEVFIDNEVLKGTSNFHRHLSCLRGAVYFRLHLAASSDSRQEAHELDVSTSPQEI
jgi:hypothetical protein